MIVPMKKVSLVVLESKKRDALKKLRKEGIVHLNTLDVKGSSVEQLKVEKQVLESTLQKLSEIGKSVEKTQNRTLKTINGEKEFVELHENVIQLLKSEDKLKEEIQKLSLEKEKLAPWGDFSVEDIKNLKEKDVDLNFYFVGKKESSLIEEDINYLILQRGKKSNLIATVNRELNDGLGAQKLTLPKYSLSEIEQNVATKKEELTKIFDQLVEYSDYTPTYKKEIEVVEQDLNFEIASDSMGVDEKLAYIAGYLPIDVVDSFKELAKKESWGYLLTDPAEDEESVPTKVKNKKWISIIEPVFDILGTVPGYKEYDISMWFLMFFTLFFAMIVGDGAYGLIFLAVAVLMHRKLKKANNAIVLLYVLSIANVVWGALTGTWFGSVAILEKLPFLQALVIPQISNYPELFGLEATSAQQTVMKFCFIVGTLQLSLGSGMNIHRKIGQRDLSAVSDLGWLVMILSLYFLVLMLVIGSAINVGAVASGIGIGFLLVVLFGAQGPGIPFVKGLAGGAAGLFSTFLDSISAFSNIISYIRLFAVGMASLAIAQSFNSMAGGMLKGFALPAGLLVLAIGHGLNLVMALLSVVVHGVRLNLLEFSGQLGMEWTGINYNPFRETVKKES